MGLISKLKGLGLEGSGMGKMNRLGTTNDTQGAPSPSSYSVARKNCWMFSRSLHDGIFQHSMLDPPTRF